MCVCVCVCVCVGMREAGYREIDTSGVDHCREEKQNHVRGAE